jgi:regulator of chromosome condensation
VLSWRFILLTIHYYCFSGCNDEGSLGRPIEDEEEECFVAGPVELPGKVKQISAGDSHSVALTEDGRVYYWGTFRDSSGSFGLTPDGQMRKLPVHLPLPGGHEVAKITSGSDHLAMLTTAGELYTVGCAEQGQLGRVAERFVARGGRRGLELLLLPDRVHAKNRRTVFADVWAGSYDTLALSTDNEMLVCGLNNYNQVCVSLVVAWYKKQQNLHEPCSFSAWRSQGQGTFHPDQVQGTHGGSCRLRRLGSRRARTTSPPGP